MSLTVATNIPSLTAQRNLQKSQNQLAVSLERLSSGLRINSAKDDAAGLAISDRMTAQIRGLNQAARNANDGISLAQTAEGAMQESINILQRIRELSIQSANDTNTATDRESLQAEVNQLVTEFYRIRSTTEFNNLKLLDGSFTEEHMQVGANAGETIPITIGSIGIGRYTDPIPAVNEYQTDTFNSTGHSGTGSSSIAFTGYPTPPDHVNTIQDQELTVTGLLGNDSVHIDDNFTAKEVADAINSISGNTGVSATASTTMSISNFSTGDIEIVIGNRPTYVGSFFQALENINATIQDDDVSNLADEINATFDNYNGAGTGLFDIEATAEGGTLHVTQHGGNDFAIWWFDNAATTNSTLLVETPSDTVTIHERSVSSSQNGTIVTGQISLSSDGAFTVSSDADPVTGGSVLNSASGVDLTSSHIETPAVDSEFVEEVIDISTISGAQEAIEITDDSLKRIDEERGKLGAIQNRFESTISNLQNIAENLSHARSRIQDADIAKETSQMTKQSILQQAGASVLSQANSQPELALQLLK